jgi:hypothetical protein
MFSKTSFLPGICIAAALTISGCNGGSSTPPSVSINASATTVDAVDAVTLTATVTNDTNNAGVTWAVSGGGTLSNTSTSAATYTAPAATSTAQTVKVTATSVADNAVSNSITLTIPAQLAVTTTNAQLTGSAGTAFSVQLTATGGIAPYKWSVASSSLLRSGWTLSSTGLLTGPAIPSWSGAFDFTVDVADSGASTPLSSSAPLTVVSAPATSNAHTSYVSGTWVCSIGGAFDKDGARWAALTSFQTDGDGNITGGAIDENSRDFTAALSGTITGAYSIYSDNNGVLTTNVAWSNHTASSNSFAIALNDLAGPSATRARLVEIDDVGASPSGRHGSGICYPATTSAFVDSTLNGNFIYNMDGETSTGAPQAHVGRFTASNGQITAGVSDGIILPTTTDDSYTFTGSYSTPDSTTGRYTVTLNPSNSSTTTEGVGYIVNATLIYRLTTLANGGLVTGEDNSQNGSSFTDASLNGAIVSYGSGRAYSGGSISSYDAWVDQGSADGSGNFTINQSYTNAGGSYTSGAENSQKVTVTFDQNNLGRATFTPVGGGLGYLYFNGNNNANLLVYDSTAGYLETGYFNAQTQTTFTDAAVAGNYLYGEGSVAAPGVTSEGEFNLASNGTITGGLSSGGDNYAAFDQPQPLNYQWDSSATGYGGLLIGSGSSEDSCVINSSTRVVCIVNTSPQAASFILLQ